MADEIITRGAPGPPEPPGPTAGVTYHRNRSSSDTEITTDYSGTLYGFSEIGFSNGDYICVEWNTASDGSGTTYYPYETVPYLPFDVYAIWKDPDTAYQTTFGELNSVAQAIRTRKYNSDTTNYYVPLEFPTEFVSTIDNIGGKIIGTSKTLSTETETLSWFDSKEAGLLTIQLRSGSYASVDGIVFASIRGATVYCGYMSSSGVQVEYNPSWFSFSYANNNMTITATGHPFVVGTYQIYRTSADG